MKALSVFLLLVLFPFGLASSQVDTSTPNTQGCYIFHLNKIAIPFRIAIAHDPAIKKSITQSHDDPQSALQIEGADPTQQGGVDAQTHLVMTSNSTDNWTIQLNLQFASDTGTQRSTSLDIQSGNDPLYSQKMFSTGINFCLVISLNAVPPVHIPTGPELLTMAKEIQEAEFIVHDQKIDDNTSTVKTFGYGIYAFAFLVFCALVFCLLLLFDKRRNLSKLKDEYEKARKNFEGITSFYQARDEYRQITSVDQSNKIIDLIRNEIVPIRNSLLNAISDTMLVLKTGEITERLTKLIQNSDLKVEHIVETLATQTAPQPQETREKIQKPEEKKKKGHFSLFKKKKDKPPQEQIEETQPELKPITSPEFVQAGPEFDKWYMEYRSDKYKDGKLVPIWNKLLEKVNEDPKCKERIQLDAIARILEEDRSWP